MERRSVLLFTPRPIRRIVPEGATERPSVFTPRILRKNATQTAQHDLVRRRKTRKFPQFSSPPRLFRPLSDVSSQKLAGLAASNQVALGRLGCVLSKDSKCETQRRSVAPSGMIRQRGRGLKLWDTPLLAPG